VAVHRDVVNASVARIPYGARTMVRGSVRRRDGVPLGNQTVWILTGPDDGSSGFTYVAKTITAANGIWTAMLPPGPSRRVKAVYSGSATTEPSSSPVRRLIVPAKIQFSVSPTGVPWGGEVLVRGRLLGGYLPAHAAAVSKLLRLLVGTARWQRRMGIADVDRWGRFHAVYCLRPGRGVAGSWLSVSTLSVSGYPYAPASSRRVRLTVGPGNARRRCRG
jgi:hypothetical protein